MIVATKSGKISGIEENGMLAFKGIPFAKAPIGKLRFKPPVPIEPWAGIAKAVEFGNRSLQIADEACKDNISFSEDCLNLNVWTPAIDNKKRPVIFFIHGGGHVSGGNSDMFIDGPHLIRGRDSVMVAANYRLGALGYLYLGDILGEEYGDSGNCGLLDQILALQWVKDNIAAFGGDPDMVVLMGQSAGGKSVANLMVTPAAKGLFHRAIIQSGSVQCIRDTQTATNITKLLLERLGISDRPEQILTRKGEEILAAQKDLYEVIDSAHLFGPILDGRTIMEEPKIYIEKGKLGDIPVLIGYNKEELFYSDSSYDPTEDEIKVAFKRCYGENWKIALHKYQELKNNYSSQIAFDKTQTLCVYGNATISLTQMLIAAGNKVWSYRWDYGGEIGRAQHSSEIPYIFGYIKDNDRKYDEVIETLSKQMNETWMSFICNGSPENKNIPAWPHCDDAKIGYRMHIDEVFHLEEINLNSYYHEFPLQVIKL